MGLIIVSTLQVVVRTKWVDMCEVLRTTLGTVSASECQLWVRWATWSRLPVMPTLWSGRQDIHGVHIKGRQVHEQMWEICSGTGPSGAEGLQNGNLGDKTGRIVWDWVFARVLERGQRWDSVMAVLTPPCPISPRAICCCKDASSSDSREDKPSWYPHSVG